MLVAPRSSDCLAATEARRNVGYIREPSHWDDHFMLIYKIHPALGVARVADRPTAFCLGPENPGEPGVEIGAGGAESPLAQYKTAGQIKRQGARFRVFEYDKNPATGALTLQREVTASDAQIAWKVELVNRKAAFNRIITPTVDLGV